MILQAVLDAQSAQKEQQAWLKENLQTHFARKLLRMVDKIAKFVLAGDGKPEHAFPSLAGSHLSAVSLEAEGACIAMLLDAGYPPSRLYVL